METVVYLVCILAGSFVVLAQPAVTQVADTILPLTYPAQVLQGGGSQTCNMGEYCMSAGMFFHESEGRVKILLARVQYPVLHGN